MLKFLFVSVVMLTLSSAHSAQWYVDNQAAGANSGESWTDAWTNTTAIVWNRINAGDTIYLSGSTNMYTGITAPKSGAPGAPITIRVGQDAGHNSLVELGSFNFGTQQHLVLDGSLNPDFPSPTNVLKLSTELPRNIGLKIWHNDWGGSSQGIFVSGAAGQNNTIRWVEIGPILTNVDGDSSDGFGIRFLNITVMTNFVVEYCYIHDIRNDGINLNDITGPAPQHFDACTVRWTYIGRTGDDGIQWSENGLSVENCFFDSHLLGFYHGHPDQIQFAGVSQGYFKVVNNVLRNKANSLIIGEHLITEGGTIGPMLIAGNIFYATRDWPYITNSIQAYGVSFSAWRPNKDVSVRQGFLSGFYYLHNTMYFQTTEPFKVGRTGPNGYTRSVWDLQIRNSAIRNNLHIHNKWNAPQAAYSFNAAGSGAPGTGTNGIFYSMSDLPMTHNINTGPNKSAAYFGTSEMNISAFGNGNSSAQPSVETNGYTFQLQVNDTVAKDAAYPVESLTNQFPELMVDLAGNNRFADSSPDIGAREFKPGDIDGVSSNPDDGLLLWLNFEDALTDGQAGDISGRGNHATRFGHLNTPTNWPTASTYIRPVTGTPAKAAQFAWQPGTGWGLYNKSGDYMAVTNVTAGGLQSLNQATVMLWVKRDAAPDGDLDGLNEWQDDQGRYICSGYGYSGAWSVGMFSDRGIPYAFVRVYTNNSANSDSYAWFGEGSRVSTGRNINEGTLPWTHFAFSWNNGILKTYCNGTNIDNVTLPINTLTVRGPNGNLSTGWIGLGCDTHNGNPALTPLDDVGEQYPNHAWFAGEMDDVMIYGRVLSNEEIKAVYRGSPLNPATRPPPAPSGLRLQLNNP
ncbi:MAG: LamG domain-containing protein [Akkermansiaceae bacterium]|nr:LamG domain-containing protein [Verrucomicrobiales bacterium]